LQLRQGLKKKIRPLTESPEQIPISVFLLICEIDSTLFTRLMQLCKGLKQHMEYGINERFKPVCEGIKTRYANQLKLERSYLWT
jgi:hypothetical protein